MDGSREETSLRPPKRRGYLGETIRTLAFNDIEMKRCSYKDPNTGAWKGRWVESKYPAYVVWTWGLDGWRHYVERTISGTCTKGKVAQVTIGGDGNEVRPKKPKTGRSGENKRSLHRGSGVSSVHQVSKPGRIVMRRKGKIQELPKK